MTKDETSTVLKYCERMGSLRLAVQGDGDEALAVLEAKLGVAQRHIDRLHDGTFLHLFPQIRREIERSIREGGEYVATLTGPKP